MTVAIPDIGTVYTFTNASSRVVGSFQNGIPALEPGQTVDLAENKLRPAHFGMVLSGDLSVSPELPPDLVQRAASFNWQDGEFRKVVATFEQKKDSLTFDANAPSVGSVGEEVEVELQLQDAAGDVLFTDSIEEVDITASAGQITDITGGVSGTLNTVGPIRAKASSGVIKITVLSDSAQTVTLSLANPSTAGLTVSDTHDVVYS